MSLFIQKQYAVFYSLPNPQMQMLHNCMNIIFHGQAKQISLLSIFKVALTSGEVSANAAALPPLDLFRQMAVNIVFEGNANAGHKGGSISLMAVFIGQLVNIKMMVEATAASNCRAGRLAACWMRINFNRIQSTPLPFILSTPFFLFSHPLLHPSSL